MLRRPGPGPSLPPAEQEFAMPETKILVAVDLDDNPEQIVKVAADLASKLDAGLVLVHVESRALAIDHAREGIRANVVCPGAIDTPMLRNAMARRDRAEDDVARRLSLFRLDFFKVGGLVQQNGHILECPIVNAEETFNFVYEPRQTSVIEPYVITA